VNRLDERFGRVARLVAGARDLLDARPRDGTPPAPIVERGWSSFLASLSDGALDALESRGLAAEWPEGAPESLRALIAEARRATEMPRLYPGAVEPRRLRSRESARKQRQVDAFTAMVGPLAARSRRVVDVGAGHGHLTRAVAERLSVPVLGLERDRDLAARARTLGDEGTTFAVTDVLRDGLPLCADDCVIGLHACGELGDEMVVQAAAHGAAIALVGCCLQKRRQEVRRMLSVDDSTGEALDLPKAVLGLSNLTARDEGVEATRAENLAARARRLALRKLLEEHVAPLRPGAEIDGLNRRVAQRDLTTLVTRAFSRRGLPIPSTTAIGRAAAWAEVHHARMRRFALPRSMLARALEVLVLLDRARHLERRGYRVTVGELFPETISTRNLALGAELSG
jgi:protein-L-isoaspartate O-methyltransferase